MPTLSEKALKGNSKDWGYVSSYLEGLDIEYPKTSGIYKIKNIINNKVYVGSANNLDRRIKKHLWELCKERHRNSHLQRSFHKFGIESFYVIILEQCEISILIEREQFWIDYYDSSKRDNGYNKQPFAYSNKSNQLSKETKDKISAFQKGKPKSELHNYKNSIAHLGSKNGMFGKKISEKCRQAIIANNIKSRLTYHFINPQGEPISFTGLANFCKENNLSAGAMCQVAKGTQNHHKKWTKNNNI